MQLIGLLGGMSWESTGVLPDRQRDRARPVRGLHSARCHLLGRLRPHRAHAGGRELGRGGRRAGPRRTGARGRGCRLPRPVHQHHAPRRGRRRRAVDIPLLHIEDTTAAAVTGAGVRRVGLLGTGFTMSCSPSTPTGSPGAGSRSCSSSEDRDVVHRIIYDELCLGVIREESREEYRRVICGLVEVGAEGSSTAAPRSSCWSGSRTARSRSSPPPDCTSRRRSSGRWRATEAPRPS